jgi:hypothetical protein
VPAEHRRITALAVALVSAVAVAPYLQTLPDYFAGDDFGVAQHFFGRPWWYVLTLFNRAWVDGIYGYVPDELRPLVGLTYQVDGWLGQGSQVPFHTTNLILHVVTTVLVFGIARRALLLETPAAAFAAMLFSILPIHAETVAWISGRADSVYTVFYLGSFLAFVVGRERRGLTLYGLSVFCFFCGLFSKQSTITLPILLLLYDILSRRHSARDLIKAHAPFFALLGGYLTLRRILFGQTLRLGSVTIETLGRFARLQVDYLQLLLTNHLTATPIYQLALFAAAVLLFIAAWALTSRRDRRMLLLFGPIWWAMTTAPTLVADYATTRHLYLPAVAYGLTAGLTFQAFRSRGFRLWPRVAAAVLLVAYGVWLLPAIRSWREAARTAESFHRETIARLAEVPADALMLLDPPTRPSAPAVYPHVWVMQWAYPFALRPPFTPRDFTQTRAIAWIQPADCCSSETWQTRTGRVLRSWAREANGTAPVVTLTWNPSSRTTDAITVSSSPRLRQQIADAVDAPKPDEAARAFELLVRILRD